MWGSVWGSVRGSLRVSVRHHEGTRGQNGGGDEAHYEGALFYEGHCTMRGATRDHVGQCEECYEGNARGTVL